MLDALVAGGLSLVSGLGARSAAKSQQRRADAKMMKANEHNEARLLAAQKHNKQYAKNVASNLNKIKETTVERSNVTNSVDVEGMMKAAEAAGFNPVTFLQNGGMAAYARTASDTTTTRRGHNAGLAAQIQLQGGLQTPFQEGVSETVNIPSVAQAVGQAGTAAFNVLRDDYVREQAQDFQREMLNTQLGAVQRNAMPRSFYVPGFSTSGPITTTTTRGGLAGVGTPTAPTAGDRTNTNPFPVGSGIDTNPRFVDAEQAESRYGDIMQEVFGLLNLGADAVTNVGGYLKTSPTAQRISDFVSGLGLSVKYDPKPKPLTFTVKPKGP